LNGNQLPEKVLEEPKPSSGDHSPKIIKTARDEQQQQTSSKPSFLFTPRYFKPSGITPGNVVSKYIV
jgi:hypothetical protein